MYGIVNAAGGNVEVESDLGGGSVFRVYFPAVVDTPPSPDATHPVEPAHRGGNETILLVEDEPAVRQFAQRVLEGHGYLVRAFGDPVAALEEATRDPGSYDALVTDVVMPALRGPALAERILAARPDLPVLFMSGYEAGELPPGAPNPLSKPSPRETSRRPSGHCSGVGISHRGRALVRRPASRGSGTYR